jgi:hypothetical protein
MDDFYRYPHGLETSKCWYMSWGTPTWYGFTCLREWDIIWTEADMMGNRSNNISIRLGLGTLNWSVPNHQPWTKPSKFGVRFSWTISMYYTSIVYLLVPTHWIRPRMQHNFVLGWFPYIPILKNMRKWQGSNEATSQVDGNSIIFLFFLLHRLHGISCHILPRRRDVSHEMMVKLTVVCCPRVRSCFEVQMGSHCGF